MKTSQQLHALRNTVFRVPRKEVKPKLYDHSEQTGSVITILLTNGAKINVTEEKAIEFAIGNYDYPDEDDMDDSELYVAATYKLDKYFDEVMSRYYNEVIMASSVSEFKSANREQETRKVVRG